MNKNFCDKNSFKISFLYILLFCLIVSSFVGCSNDTSQNNDNSKVCSEVKISNQAQGLEVENFLKNNHATINLKDNNDVSSFSLLNSSLEGYTVFLTGEAHGVAANTDVQIKLLKYLNEKAGVKYFLIERGYSDSVILNRYLKTGDENILKQYYEGINGTLNYTINDYEMWKKLYEYNKKKSIEDKIKVIGIDVEYTPLSAFKCMYSLIPHEEAPSEIKPTIEKFKALNDGKISLKTQEIEPYFFTINEDINKNRSIYEKYFKGNLFDFEFISNNIYNFFNSTRVDFEKLRDQCIYENFLKIYTTLPKGKFFGEFGLDHISHKKYGEFGVDKFNMLLRNESNSPVKSSVVSIPYIYKGCKTMFDTKEGYNTNVYNTFDMNNKVLEPFLESDFTLFRLDGQDSPFQKKLIWLLSNGGYAGDLDDQKEVTTDYYQYCIVIQNSEAAKPFK